MSTHTSHGQRNLALFLRATEQLAPSELRASIDAWVGWLVGKGPDAPAAGVASKDDIAALPMVLVSVLKPIEDLYFKWGGVAFSESPNFYDEFVRLLQDALKADAAPTNLVAKVVDFDLGEVKRFGNPGKKAPADIAEGSYYAKSGLEKSLNRLLAVLANGVENNLKSDGWS